MTNQPSLVGEELDPILLDLGSALFVCQGLEGSLVFLLSVCAMEDADAEDGSFRAAMDSLSQRTLGQLLKRLRERLEISGQVDEQFRAGWAARNWIVHEFLHDSVEDLITPKGRLVVSNRLAKSKEVVKRTDILANKILNTYLHKYGLSVEETKASADRLWAHLNQSPSRPDH